MNVVITGGSSGLGKAVKDALQNQGNSVHNIDINFKEDEFGSRCDVQDLGTLFEIAKYLDSIDILINCAGTNFINWIENTSDGMWDEIIGTNAKGIFNTCKAFMDNLIKNKGTILNIVSNASHMPMTNSIAYNASKGAAHIMTLQMARELGPKGITVFGISPNKLSNTGMSDYIDKTVPNLRGWTKEQAAEYQRKSLPAGEETDTETLAEFIAFLLSSKQRHKYLAGCILNYGA